MSEKENEMSHRDSEEEKLVEEIAQNLVSHYHPNFLFVKPTDWDREIVQDIITRILKAVVDGMPLPGEVGRWIPGDETGGNFAWRILKEIGCAPILIALRKEGTGKEEEPSFIAEIH